MADLTGRDDPTEAYICNNKSNIFTCPLCKVVYYHLDQLEIHLLSHTGEKSNKCFKCGKSFKTKKSLLKHIKIHIYGSQNLCSKCGKTFAKKQNLIRHVATHEMAPYACDLCDKVYSQFWSLKRHKLSHLDSKPFKCDHCPVTCDTSSHLEQHVRIHSGERPYKCSHCSKRFTQNSSLTKHLRVHSGDRPYVCSDCGKTYTENGHLKIHMRKHTGDKPFKCPTCSRSFYESGNLRQHMRIHSGEKLCKCFTCGKSFRHNGDLKEHLNVHSKERPFKCDICKKCFKAVRNLRRHKKTQHAKSKADQNSNENKSKKDIKKSISHCSNNDEHILITLHEEIDNLPSKDKETLLLHTQILQEHNNSPGVNASTSTVKNSVHKTFHSSGIHIQTAHVPSHLTNFSTVQNKSLQRELNVNAQEPTSNSSERILNKNQKILITQQPKCHNMNTITQDYESQPQILLTNDVSNNSNCHSSNWQPSFTYCSTNSCCFFNNQLSFGVVDSGFLCDFIIQNTEVGNSSEDFVSPDSPSESCTNSFSHTSTGILTENKCFYSQDINNTCSKTKNNRVSSEGSFNTNITSCSLIVSNNDTTISTANPSNSSAKLWSNTYDHLDKDAQNFSNALSNGSITRPTISCQQSLNTKEPLKISSCTENSSNSLLISQENMTNEICPKDIPVHVIIPSNTTTSFAVQCAFHHLKPSQKYSMAQVSKSSEQYPARITHKVDQKNCLKVFIPGSNLQFSDCEKNFTEDNRNRFSEHVKSCTEMMEGHNKQVTDFQIAQIQSESITQTQTTLCETEDTNRCSTENMPVQIRISENSFSCSKCQETFDKANDFVSHIKAHNLEKVKSFPNKNIWKKSLHDVHFVHCNEESHSICGIQDVKDAGNANRLYCGECGKSFAKRQYLWQHMKLHLADTRRNFQCPDCSKSFYDSGHLKSHMLIHTGAKPFECDICKRRFRMKGDLVRHMRIHTGEKPFRCQECGKSFTIKESLKRHLRIHSGDHPYCCHFCGKTFAQKGNMIQHLRTHKQK